ncbi:MAG: hypothetical protein EPO32_11720 [Anaerolineae bacterium]|nr:MAG: hypothetical protein EPO32_11720 [Anaerolineae bacterium]
MNPSDNTVPPALRRWFVAHFFADLLFAIPLMLLPVATLRFFGWQHVDPIATRMVSAAMFGIGIESWLGRDSGREAYIGMLNLKIIWSLAVILGVSYSLLAGAQGEPPLAWLILSVFVLFNLVWMYWRIRLARTH